MSSSPAAFLSIWEVGCCPVSHCLSHSQFRSQCCLKDWFLETAIQMRQGVSRDHFGKQSLKSAKCLSWKWLYLLQFLRIGTESSQAQEEDSVRDPIWLLTDTCFPGERQIRPAPGLHWERLGSRQPGDFWFVTNRIILLPVIALVKVTALVFTCLLSHAICTASRSLGIQRLIYLFWSLSCEKCNVYVLIYF